MLLGGYRQAGSAALSLAAANANLGQSGYALFFALRGASAELAVFGTLAIAAYAAGRQLATIYDEATLASTRLAVSLAHIKTDIGIEELQAYARARQEVTGIDDEATLALANQLIQLNFNKRELMGLLPLLQDLHALEPDKDPIAVARQIHRSLITNNARGLADLGLQGQKIIGLRTPEAREQEIETELRGKVGGAAEATATSLQLMVQEIKELGKALADLLNPFVQLFVFLIRDTVNFIKNAALAAREALGRIPGFNERFPTAQQAGEQKAAELAQKNNWQQSQITEQVKAAKETAHNTRATHDAMTRYFLGGGAAAQGALNIRGVNYAFRAAR